MQKNKLNSENSFRSNIYFRLSTQYLGKSIILLAVLIFIALFVRDNFIRPIGGDVLVVIWLYYLFASVLFMPKKLLICVVLFIAYLVELGQLLQLNIWLGIEPSSTLSLILGATFDWRDLIAYTAGAAICYLVDAKEKTVILDATTHPSRWT
jgi:hypothetical protein